MKPSTGLIQDTLPFHSSSNRRTEVARAVVLRIYL